MFKEKKSELKTHSLFLIRSLYYLLDEAIYEEK